ncbi:MAG: chemotaxis protein CheA [Novosphingobium sp.]
MTNDEILAIFFIECEESLATVEVGLGACATESQDSDTVNAIFRAVHSIKGGAGAFGFFPLQEFAHSVEALLSDVRDDAVPVTTALIELLLRSLDTLSDHVTAARDGGDAPEDASLLAALVAALAGSVDDRSVQSASETACAEPEAGPADSWDSFDLDSLLDDITGAIAPASEVAAQDWQLMIRPHAGAMGNGGEPMLLLRELAELGGICTHCDLSQLPPLDRLDPAQGYLGWTFTFPTEVAADTLHGIFDFLGDDCAVASGADAVMPPVRIGQPAPTTLAATAAEHAPSAPEKKAGASAAPDQSIRIDLSKLDGLIDSVGELIIAQAMLAQRCTDAGIGANEDLAKLEGLTRDIQEGAMALRAQPIGTVFSRVPRILRELTQSTGKRVELIVSGEATELDKMVIERLGEPLTHLIRNAIDHGIESADERLAAGKSAEGTLTLSAEHRSSRIVIRLADNGRGIDRARVRSKAIEKGLISAEAQLSNEEIDNLIFAPGFSTAQVVSNISGRGVGMDVVRQNVKELGGRIAIESVEGSGTSFTITLPLTLAISDGMIVDVGDQTLIVPLANVVESLRPEPHEVIGLGTSQEMLNVRGRFIPILPVGLAIDAPSDVVSADRGVLIVIETEASGQVALLVDAIRDQRQFVIKSLKAQYGSVEGIAGATILGDGRIALILNVDGLVASALKGARAFRQSLRTAA